MQEMLIEFLREILFSGLFVVAGGIIVLELAKILPFVKRNNDLLPWLVIPVCMILGVALPAFSELDAISQAIAGGVCGMAAPIVYDKWVKPIGLRLQSEPDQADEIIKEFKGEDEK